MCIVTYNILIRRTAINPQNTAVKDINGTRANSIHYLRKEAFTMSYKELAKTLIDQIPESKMYYIVAYLQGAAIPDEIPNAETIASIEELESGGTIFTGGTEDLFLKLLEE